MPQVAYTLTEQDHRIYNHITNKLNIIPNEGQRHLSIPTRKTKLCSAVPGSGKTTMLGLAVTCEELIAKIPGNRMHVMTFTKKATDEFKHRHMVIMDKLGLRSNVHVSTIHALCHKYVGMFYERIGMLSVTLMGDKDGKELLKRIIATVLGKKEGQINSSQVNEVLNCISFLDNRLVFDKAEVIKTSLFISLDMPFEEFQSIREIYQSSQRNGGKLTQDQWVLCYYEILRDNEDIRIEVQNQLDSLFVDEFQDTTKLQFEIIRMMKGPNTSLTAVGDSDQSIYRWRGASDVYQLFIKAFPDYEHVKMNTNYRCPDYVIQTSNALIRNNTNRMDVKAVGTGKQGKLEIIPTRSNQIASMDLANRIVQDYEASGRDNNILLDKLVMYRNHSQGMFLVYELATQEVPINTSGVLLPHRDKIVKDMLELVIFLDNPRSSSRASKNMHFVCRQLNKPKNQEKCPFYNSTEQEHFAEIPVNVKNKKEYEDELRKLIEISKMVRDKEPASKIFKELLPMYMNAYYGYRNIGNLMGKTEEDVSAICQFLLIGIKREYTIDQFRYTLMKVEQFLIDSNKQQVGLKILSIHSSKGLEAKQVYLLDTNGMVQPNPKVINTLLEARAYEALEDYINEERSLMFVAMTRTLEDLYVFYNKENPSPFNWESGLNEQLRAKAGILTLETLGVIKDGDKQYHQQTQQRRGVSPIQQAAEQQKHTTPDKTHPLTGHLPESVLSLFNRPATTKADSLTEMANLARQMEQSVENLERTRPMSTKTRLDPQEVN